MNRITLCEDEVYGSLQSSPPTSRELLQFDDNQPGFESEIFIPEKYEKGYAYPLIVWLHGGGRDQRQIRYVMPKISQRNYAAVAPCGSPEPSLDHIDRQLRFWKQTPADVTRTFDAVSHAVKKATLRLNIARDKIFLAGFADGGTMAMRLALTYPKHFAGVATLNGPLPANHRPVRAFDAIRATQFFLGYGKDGTIYPPQRVATDLKLLFCLGAKVRVTQFNTDDEPTEEMFSMLNRWMMEIVTGESWSTEFFGADSRQLGAAETN